MRVDLTAEEQQMLQNSDLLPWRTVQANVEFGLEVLDMEARARTARASQYIELVGLKGFERYFPHQISGGMQQRVGIARALARDPTILLMDDLRRHRCPDSRTAPRGASPHLGANPQDSSFRHAQHRRGCFPLRSYRAPRTRGPRRAGH